MKKYLLICLTLLSFGIGRLQAQCRIEIGILPPTLCVGNTLCAPINIFPPGCIDPACVRIEVSQPLSSPGAPCNFSPPALTKIGNCIDIPLFFQKGRYCVRLRCGNIVSDVRTVDIDTIDVSAAPTFSMVQIPPIRPSYCPTDTVCFKVTNINAGVGFTIQWLKNDSSLVGAIDSVFCIAGLKDGDFVSVRVSKQNKCALNATKQADSISLKVNKKPLIQVVLAPGFTGCEKAVNSFIAKLDSAGTDPLVIWTRVTNGRTDTLSQGINDTLFTLTPSDSSLFGDQICAEVITGRCQLKASNCFFIRACGEVFIDPPLDTIACAGTEILIPYTIVGTFTATNLFKVQLSDSLGNFSAPIQIGTLLSRKADTIRALIPVNSNGGDCFRVRIISSSPPDTSDTSACIKIFPRPVSPIATHDSVCKAGNVTLEASSSNPGLIFNWYTVPFGGVSVFTGNTRTIFITRDTVFYVSSVSPNGCESERVPIRGIINPTPNVEAGPDKSICFGALATTLTPFPVGGIWSGGLTVVNDAVDLSGVLPGEYKLIYSITNALGCTGVDSLIVRIKPIPVVNAGADFSVCTNNQPISLTGSPSGGIWSGDNVQSDGVYQPSIATQGTDTLFYSLSQEGCVGVDTVLVTVREAPPIFTVTTTNPSACNVDDGSATLAGITTGPGFKVKWSVNRADSLSDPTISNLGAGAYTVVVTDLSTQCIRRGSFGLSDPLAPAPIISGLQANYCSGDTCSTLSVIPNSPSGTWSGTGLVFEPGGVVRFCPNVANSGPNNIVYSYDTAGGCTGSTSLIARVDQSPVVNAGGPADTACSDAGTFQLTGFSPEAPPATWGPQPLVSLTGLVNPALAAVGNNVLTLTRTVAGCTSSSQRNFFVYPKPDPTISRNPTSDVCLGQTVTLTAIHSNGASVIRYEWFKNNIIIPNENTDVLVVSEPGSYSVVIVGSGDCPGVSSPVQVNFNAVPTNGVTPSGILSPCSNNLTTLTADSGAGYTYQWFEMGDPIVGQTGRTFTPSLSGEYRVRVENALGCFAFSTVVTVGILPAPEAPIISPPFSDTCLQAGQPITITVGASGSGLSFQWFKVGTPDQVIIGQNDPVLDTITTPGSYFVFVEASNGCSTRSDTMNILPTINISILDTLIQKCVGDNPFVVSGFSPNNGTLFYNGAPLTGRLWNPNTVGDFTLTYQVANANGCISRKNLVIRINQIPPANLVVLGATNVCQGDTVRLVINNGNETGCAYQLIRNGIDLGGPFTTPFVNVTQPGNYSVLVTCSRCSSLSNILPITFRRKPRAEAGPLVQACAPLITNLNNRPGVTPGTWSGSPRVVTSGNYNSAGFIGCEVLTLTVDSSNGCSSTDTVRICIDSIPEFSIATQNSTACQAIDGSAWVTGNTSGYSFSWIRVGNTDVLSTDDTLQGVQPGPYQVRITSNLNGCFRIYPAIINSPNNLDVSIAGLPDSVCVNGNPIQLFGIPADSGTFTSFGNRIIPTNRFNPTIPGPAIDTVYYTANLNGCVGTAKKTIKINPLPVVDAGPDVEVCLGDTLVLQAIQPSGVPLIWVGPQVENDSLYIAFDPGITTSQVTFGYSLNGCTATDSKIVKVNSLPDFNVVPTNVSNCGSCDGSAVREIVNSAQYQTIWRNLTNGSVIGTGNSISNRCVGVYSCEVIQITTGCKKEESFGISGPTNIDPFVCLQNVPVALCQNDPPVTIGKCKPNAVVFIGGVPTEILNPATFIPDNIAVLLTFTDTNGCTGVEQKSVEIKPVPSVNVAGTGPVFACTNQTSVQLSGFFPDYDPSVPENGWTVVGAAPPGFISRSGVINASVVPNDAVFTLRYTSKFADPNGCSESKTIQFRVYRTPVAVIQPAGPSLTVCEGTTVTLSSQNTAPNYTWFLGNQSNPPAVGFGPTLSASLPGVYRLQLNNNGCRSDLSGVLLLNTTPAPIIANIGADTVICQGNPFVFFPPTVIGNTTSQCWETITTAPGLINCSGLISPNAVPPGVYNLRYVASNGSCSDTAFRTVTIIPNIDSEILGAQTLEICEGDTAILVAGATGTGVGYEWLVGNVSIPGSNNDTLFVTQAGEYRVRILINGNGTCASASTDFAVVSVKPSPNVSYSGDPLLKVCFPGPPADLNTIRPYAPFDATWSYSGPEAIVTPNGLLRPENFVADGLYTLILQKTIGTCSDTVSLKIQANRIPDATFSSTSQTICEGQNIELNYVNPLNYNTTWFRENAVVAINQDSLLLSQAGTYKLLVDNNGCSDEKSASFEVQPLPTFELPGNTESCKNGTSLQFFPINPSPGLGAWSGPGVSGTGGWDPSDPDVPASGPITISYTRTSEFGCAVTKSFEILINPVPAIQLNSNLDTIEIFGPAILTATGGSGYVWSPANSLSAATGPEVNARPSESTEYTVTVTTEKGCIGSAKKLIVVDQEFKIYDGFSPNDDQRNDRWVIKNIQRYPAARVKVFNRWGNEVYASEPGYPKPWDGKYEGNPVPPGAYYYVVDLGEGLTAKSGSITIVR